MTTELLGKASIPDLPFENADGSPLRLDTDYFGKQRNADNPFPGPFERHRTESRRSRSGPGGRPDAGTRPRHPALPKNSTTRKSW